MKIIYYYHIPKCGGSTISKVLRTLAARTGGEYHNFNFPMQRFSSPVKLYNNFRMKRFLHGINRKANDFQFVHHHHGYYGVGEIFQILSRNKRMAEAAGNEFYLFTCIRDPLSFQVSLVNYLRHAWGRKDFTFENTCTEPEYQNVMFKYLLANHPKRWRDLDLDKELFLKCVGLMDRVFLLDELGDLDDWLRGITGEASSALTTSVNKGEHSLVPDSEQLETLKQVNKLDYFFYDHIKSLQAAALPDG